MSSLPKISFGFSKSLKKAGPTPEAQNSKQDKQYIQCIEDSSIKVIGGEVEEKAPLVIPMKNKTTTSAAILARIAKEVEPDLEEDLNEKPPPEPEISGQIKNGTANETLESKAIRELLQGTNKQPEISTTSNLVVPLAKLPGIEGEKESTIEDYESIPISDFGVAMLRGMGWKDDPNKKKKIDTGPALRPKGMGLGADKVGAVAYKPAQNGSGNSENLKLCKGSFVKIIAGKNTGGYGEAIGFDDEGRVMVKAAIGDASFNLNEYMIQVVSKDEYKKQSKVINAVKYEEYKKKEQTSSRDNRSRSKEKYSKHSENRRHEKRNQDDSSERHKRRSTSDSPPKSSKHDKRKYEENSRRDKNKRSRSRSRDKYRRQSRSRSREKYQDSKSEKHRSHKYR